MSIMYRQAFLWKLLQQRPPGGPLSVRALQVLECSSLAFPHRTVYLHSTFNWCSYSSSSTFCRQTNGKASLMRISEKNKEIANYVKTSYRYQPPWCASRCNIHSSSCDLAGHNKWSKVKYIKGPKDHEKSMITTKIIAQMKVAMKDGGSNPKTNIDLANLILLAKSKGIPKSTIENVISNAAKSKDKGGSQHICEVQGPKGSALIVEYMTDNKKRSRDELVLIIKKQGFTVGAPGSVMYSFKKKGVLELKDVDDTQPLTLDLAMELAIEVGAEDVIEVEDEDGRAVFKILCDQADFRDVRAALRNTKHSSGLESLQFLPESMITLSETDLDRLGLLISKLEDHPDVMQVYHNVTDNR